MAQVPSIRSMNDSQLIAFIQKAQRRLLVMAPGVTAAIAQAISERWLALGAHAVNIILDVDPEVYRLGYGTFEALQLLERTAKECGALVHHQPGIRIALIVVDDAVVVFSPIPELIEAGSPETTHANAIMLDFVPPKVETEIGLGQNGARDQIFGLEKVPSHKVEQIDKELKSNPPVKFDIARKVRVFNAQFEFVEFELKNVLISRMAVPIPSELMGLAGDEKAQRLLKSTFKLIDNDGELSGEKFFDLKKSIVKKYLITLPNYGAVILRTKKDAFEKEVNELRKTLESFQNQVKGSLQAEIDKNRNVLVNSFLPSVKAKPPKRWEKYMPEQPDEAIIRKLLEQELSAACGSAEQYIKNMSISVIFKGVTYELLNDSKFIEVAKARIPSLEVLHTEYDAAQQIDGQQQSLSFGA